MGVVNLGLRLWIITEKEPKFNMQVQWMYLNIAKEFIDQKRKKEKHGFSWMNGVMEVSYRYSTI